MVQKGFNSNYNIHWLRKKLFKTEIFVWKEKYTWRGLTTNSIKNNHFLGKLRVNLKWSNYTLVQSHLQLKQNLGNCLLRSSASQFSQRSSDWTEYYASFNTPSITVKCWKFVFSPQIQIQEVLKRQMDGIPSLFTSFFFFHIRTFQYIYC